MRKYESIVVFKPDLSDAQVKTELKRLEGILQSNGAANITTDHWGKRDIAYLVRKNKQGKFVALKYETADEHKATNALTAILRITDNVIKYQSHRIEERRRKFKGNPKAAQRADAFDNDYADVMEVDY